MIHFSRDNAKGVMVVIRELSLSKNWYEVFYNFLISLVRPAGLEPATYGFEVQGTNAITA